jgi:hypothetical protein
MIPSFCNQTITRLRPSTKESRGTIIPDWSNPTSKDITPVSVQPAQSTISLDGRVLGLSDAYTVYCNVDDDVLVGDRIIYDGKTFQVNEEPRVWHSPTGKVTNKQFTMIRYKG